MPSQPKESESVRRDPVSRMLVSLNSFHNQHQKRYPLIFSTAIIVSFGLAGYASLCIVENHHRKRLLSTTTKAERTADGSVSSTSTTPRRLSNHSDQELLLAAMIENAQNSDWKTNLENAVSAHKSFMLPHAQNRDGDLLLERLQKRQVELKRGVAGNRDADGSF